jgi:predicted acetyltransferase
MAVRVRTARDADDAMAAVWAIGHYFGLPRDSTRVRFLSLLPLDRVFAADDGGAVVGGAASYAVELSVPGGTVRCAGVTAVGTLPTHRRRGVLTAMMRAQLADVRERGEPIAALWASEETIYGRFGYGLASLDAMISATRDHAAIRPDLPQVGSVRLVDVDEARRLLPPLYDRIRRRSPGFLSRSRDWWELRFFDPEPIRPLPGEPLYALLEIDGKPAGYAVYRTEMSFAADIPSNRVHVAEAVGATPVATRELWRYLLSIDWVDRIQCDRLPIDHELLLLVERPNRLHWRVYDGLWVRPVDVGAALAARGYAGDGRVTLELTADPLFPDNVGTWTIDGGVVRRSRRRPDVRLDVQALGSAYLGGFTFAQLGRAGRVEEASRGGLARADALFRVDAAPYCPENF